MEYIKQYFIVVAHPQIVDNANYNDSAKSFLADWSDALKYQVSLKYHYMGGGPTSQKLRWGYESSIKYIVICATHLVSKDDNVEFKKEVSNFVKDNFIQTLIDALRTLKVISFLFFTFNDQYILEIRHSKPLLLNSYSRVILFCVQQAQFESISEVGR